MSSFVIVAILVSAINVELSSSKFITPLQGRILGGENASIESHPYQISIQNQNRRHGCGGSIISENYVVTAAHCSNAADVVRAGSAVWSSGGSLHKVVSFIRHENHTYDAKGVPIHDIAIIKVEPPFIFDATKRPVQLFGTNELAKAGAPSVATGWGRTNIGSWDLPQHLQRVTVPIVSKDVCNELYKEYRNGIPEGQICTGFLGEGGKNPCHGDSGGALTVNGKLAGIVSWVWKGQCADPVHPNVYTEVAYYRDWIRTKTSV